MIRSWYRFEVTGWPRFFIGRRPAVTLLRLGVVLLLYFGVFREAFQPLQVVGKSMEPTYHDGQRKLLNRWAYLRKDPERGDVVAIRKRPAISVVLKRVVGLPGEEVKVLSGRVYVDGRLLAEPYAKGYGIPVLPAKVLGPDQYFAIGDNRKVTTYDVISRDDILGRAGK